MKTEYAENGGFLQRDSVEHEEYAEACSTESREVDRKDGADLLEKVLIPIYEPKFSDGSYGYRPHRSAKDAILKVKEYADAVAASLQGEVITKLAKDGFVQTVALLQRIIWTILCFSHGSNLF